jgi:hypothetical protein
VEKKYKRKEAFCLNYFNSDRWNTAKVLAQVNKMEKAQPKSRGTEVDLIKTAIGIKKDHSHWGGARDTHLQKKVRDLKLQPE